MLSVLLKMGYLSKITNFYYFCGRLFCNPSIFSTFFKRIVYTHKNKLGLVTPFITQELPDQILMIFYFLDSSPNNIIYK